MCKLRCHAMSKQVCGPNASGKDALLLSPAGKMGKLIVQAVRAGGPDATANSRLKDLLAQARSSNVPRDIIDRNIKRASEKGQADFSEVDASIRHSTMMQNGIHCSSTQSKVVIAEKFAATLPLCILQVLYEAYGPGGTGFIAVALTDNLNR